MCKSLFFQDETCNFMIKDTLAQVFSCEFCETFKKNAFAQQFWATASITLFGVVNFCKKVALRNFMKFTGKHLCQRLFFNKVAGLRLFLNKVAGLRPATLLKKESLPQVLSCEFCKISKHKVFLQNTSAGCFCPCIVFFEVCFNNCV